MDWMGHQRGDSLELIIPQIHINKWLRNIPEQLNQM